MKHTKEEIAVIENRSFDVSMQMWNRYWNLFSIENLYIVGPQIPKDFFIKMKEEMFQKEAEHEPVLAVEIVDFAVKSFMEDFKKMVERTKVALGEVYYQDIFYDDADEEDE